MIDIFSIGMKIRFQEEKKNQKQGDYLHRPGIKGLIKKMA